MLLRNRWLLFACLAIFAAIEIHLAGELMAARFDWRPLWGSPVVKATMVDFTFTVIWCTGFLFDTARRQQRNAWAWLPLLLIFPTVALFAFSLTAPAESAGSST